MLYKFKSQATADLILLEPHGRQILQIIGKVPGPSGIVTVAQVPAALTALEAAVLADEAPTDAPATPQGAEEDDGEGRRDTVRLRQRVAPFAEMLRRSAAEGRDVVWGA